MSVKSNPATSATVPRRRALETGRIRVAVIGCGAVARQFHLPVLAGHEGVEVVALVDSNVERARELARDYHVAAVVADSSGLASDQVDAALIATPPAHHAPCAIDLVRRGIHVFVEKPMAVVGDDAVAMVDAANAAGVVLAVGLFRRLLPSTRLLKALIDSGLLGRPVSFDVEEGAIYGWPATTLGNMRRDLAGGGVLIDVGSHAIDRLFFVLSNQAAVIEYRDNSHGGVESDCTVRLRMNHEGDSIDGRVELSRTRRLRNSMRVQCERGLFEVASGERYRVDIRPDSTELVDAVRGQSRPFELHASWHDELKAEWYETFRVEIDDWLDAIRTGGRPKLCGSSVLPTVRLIEECYRQPKPLYEPGIDDGLERTCSASADVNADRRAGGNHRPPNWEKCSGRRVLVTGATGFIGCRVSEILSTREGVQVRALVHSPANASRLARLPVEMMLGDLRRREDVRRAVEGCDAVIHCAIGTSWGNRREIFATTVDGTRALASAAAAAGVRRFVHLSSIAIHGNDVSGILDESTPIRPPRGDDYSESKAAAERAVWNAIRNGLPAVILRPANVYGPYSRTFITRPIEHLARGHLVLAGSAETPSNTLYVDNLVEAILRSLVAPDNVCGNVFTIGEAEDITWQEFYGFFANAIGATLCTSRSKHPRRSQAKTKQSWYRGCLEILTSAELRALARRVLDTEPVGRLPRRILESSPRLRGWARRALHVDDAVVYRRSSPTHDDVVEIRPRPARVSAEKAQRILGYTPVVPRDRAMKLTLDWLHHARIV